MYRDQAYNLAIELWRGTKRLNRQSSEDLTSSQPRETAPIATSPDKELDSTVAQANGSPKDAEVPETEKIDATHSRTPIVHEEAQCGNLTRKYRYCRYERTRWRPERERRSQ